MNPVHERTVGPDVAPLIAELPDSSLMVRRLCPVHRWVVGRRVIFCAGERPSDPADHACLGYSYLPSGETWRFKNASGDDETVVVKPRLSANNAEALCATLDAGEGIAL